jgi:hypothetical protein
MNAARSSCFRIPFFQLLFKRPPVNDSNCREVVRTYLNARRCHSVFWYQNSLRNLRLSALRFDLHLDSYLPKTKTLNVPGSIGRSGCWLTGVGAGAGPNSDEDT